MVNKNIRADEVEALEQQLNASLAQLETANYRLDSLRVIVSNSVIFASTKSDFSICVEKITFLLCHPCRLFMLFLIL